MRRGTRSLLVVTALSTAFTAGSLTGCASGDVDAELRLYLDMGNLDFYEEVLFPSSRRETYDEIFVEVATYLPLQVPYKTSQVDAIITQRGDLQITSHLTAGSIYRKHHDPSALEYLKGEDWNDAEAEGQYGQRLFEELEDPDDDYLGLNEDIRLILLVNLPPPAGADDSWGSDAWDYPVDLMSNYQDTVLDDQDQELAIPEEDIELMSRLIVGGELFETVLGQRFDELVGIPVDDDAPNMVLDSLSMPGEDGRLGHATGSIDLMLEADSFSASSGIAMITGTFDVEIRADRWALEDLDVQEDLQDSSAD